MSAVASYRERPAPAALAAWAECSWELEAHEDLAHRVVPDGCIDLVWTPDGGLRVAGPNTTAFTARIPRGGAAAGVRMRPGGAPALLGLDAAGLRDTSPPAVDALGPGLAPLAEALDGAAGPRERGELMLAWLTGRRAGGEEPDPLVAAVAGRLGGEPRLGLGALSRDLGVGERHLRRRVVAGVGYGPRRLARVLRLRRALALAGREQDLGWAAVAARCGYADQAHLARDCADLAGAPPTRL